MLLPLKQQVNHVCLYYTIKSNPPLVIHVAKYWLDYLHIEVTEYYQPDYMWSCGSKINTELECLGLVELLTCAYGKVGYLGVLKHLRVLYLLG